MKKRLALFAVGLSAVAVVIFIAVRFGGEGQAPSERPIAYVVCGNLDSYDNRVYRVDLLLGELRGVSEPIDGLGSPENLAYDPVHSRLYVASLHKKWGRDMWPFTSLHVRNGEFEVLRHFSVLREGDLPKRALDLAPAGIRLPEGYQIMVSPDGNELYVAHGGMQSGIYAEVWDPNTGDMLRELEMAIRPSDVWSPDGHRVAAIWPPRPAKAEDVGRKATASKAGVGVGDVRTGKRLSVTYREDGRGLHPPWGRIEGPLIQLHGGGRVLAYDRDTGDILSDFDVDRLTGLNTLGGVLWIQPPLLDDHRTTVLRMYDFGAEHTYLVAIDVLGQKEVSRTRLGARCTNPVVAYE